GGSVGHLEASDGSARTSTKGLVGRVWHGQRDLGSIEGKARVVEGAYRKVERAVSRFAGPLLLKTAPHLREADAFCYTFLCPFETSVGGSYARMERTACTNEELWLANQVSNTKTLRNKWPPKSIYSKRPFPSFRKSN